MILNYFLLATIIFFTVSQHMNLSEDLPYCLLSFKHDETVSSRAVSLVYVSNCGVGPWRLGKGLRKLLKLGLVFLHGLPNSFQCMPSFLPCKKNADFLLHRLSFKKPDLASLNSLKQQTSLNFNWKKWIHRWRFLQNHKVFSAHT